MNRLRNKLAANLGIVFFGCTVISVLAQDVGKDSIVYRRIYRDTIIYRYDTVRLRYFIRTDTVWDSPTQATTDSEKKKIRFNPNSWGIGPSAGAYYSPFNGFDVNIGIGIQYYLFAVPSFRNPHLRNRRQHRKK
jgi:hypothetical protein